MGRAIYSQEFKDSAIKQVVDGGYSIRSVASRLGVCNKSIYTWLREQGGRSRAIKNVETVEELRDENTKLRAELKHTREERDILKKATAYFAKASE